MTKRLLKYLVFLALRKHKGMTEAITNAQKKENKQS